MFNDSRLIDLASGIPFGSRASTAGYRGDKRSVDWMGCVMSLLAVPDGGQPSIAAVATALGLIESAGLHHAEIPACHITRRVARATDDVNGAFLADSPAGRSASLVNDQGDACEAIQTVPFQRDGLNPIT